MEDIWGIVKDGAKPKTLASADQVKSVAYSGEPIPLRGAVLVGVTEFDNAQVSNLPYPLRDIQVLEERFRALKIDYVSVLTSAQKDPSRKPKMENILHEIQEMRRRITPQGFLIVVVSTHGVVLDGALNLIPTDYEPYGKKNLIRAGDLSAMICPNRGERGVLVVDYSSHHVETAQSFPDVNVESPIPLPPTRIGFAFLCSPPVIPVSFSSKFASILDELIDRKLPICANSIYAIFDKHSERWFGAPKKQMVLMSDRASSGRAPLFNWSLVSNLDSSRVNYVVTISVPVPSVHSPIPDPASMCRFLKQAVPPLRIKGAVSEDMRRFIVKISGGPPSKGPRGDKAYYSREVAAMCAEKGLPKVDVIKAMFGKLICITAASSFEVVCRGFQGSRTLQSFGTAESAPTIEYVGVLCRPEVQSPFAVHMLLDELCRKNPSLREPNTGLYVEELSQVEDGFSGDDHPQQQSYSQAAPARPLAETPAWEANPPTSPDDEGSPILAKVETQPWGKPQSGTVDEYARSELRRLEAALQQERVERKAMMEQFAQMSGRNNDSTNNVQTTEINELRDAVKRLQHNQDRLGERLDNVAQQSPERSPTRGGASLQISNEEWMVYQDQLKLLQVQLRDVQTHIPVNSDPHAPQPLAEVMRVDESVLTSRHGHSPRKTPVEMPQGRQLSDLSRKVSSVELEMNQIAQVVNRVQDAVNEMKGIHPTQRSHIHTMHESALGGDPSVGDMRVLKQRMDRIESVGGRPMGTPPAGRLEHMSALSPTRMGDGDLERKVDILQGVVDKVIASVRGLQDTGEVRRVYNDMMLEDIDTQLQGRLPSQNGATPYLPAALRNAIQSIVSTMIQTTREQIEAWTTQHVTTQRDQIGALNTATADQLHAMQGKIALLQATLDVSANRGTPQDNAIRESNGNVMDSHGKQLNSNLSAIHGLEQSISMMQNTINSHTSRLQSVEAGMDMHVAELQSSNNDIRTRVDSAIQRVGQTVVELEGKVLKDVSEATARVTVADQRIKHLDTRLAEDADRMHRIEDRVDQSTRVLQDRLEDQAQKMFEVERRVTASLDEKVGIMRQIADVAEKNSVDLERRCSESETLLKSQLRAALQQHIEGLEDVLQSMKQDLRGIEKKQIIQNPKSKKTGMEERTVMMESIVGDCKVAGSLVDQKVQMMEKTMV